MHSAKDISRRNKGFTLIEVMVVIAIMGIVLSIAVPSLRDYVGNQRMSAAANDLVATSMFARSEAIKRNADVFMIAQTGDNAGYWCVMLTNTACDTNSAANAFDPANSVMRIQPPTTDVTTGVATITFNRYGRLTSAANIAVTDVAGALPARCVTIDVTGGAAQKRSATCP